jgi:hypothetical protein
VDDERGQDEGARGKVSGNRPALTASVHSMTCGAACSVN